MMGPADLENRAIGARPLTPRQAEAAELVQRYRAVAGEEPSCSWLARRLNVSRTRAFHLKSRAEQAIASPR